MNQESWLRRLGEFLIEANAHTWAGSEEDLPGLLPGFKRLEYERGPWKLVDHYVGFFRAPGFTVVYYEGVPAWTQSYGGMGMAPNHYPLAKEAFAFLKRAILANDRSGQPFRGLGGPWSGGEDFTYRWRITQHGNHGPQARKNTWWDLLGCEWAETIRNSEREVVFGQIGSASVIIGKNDDGEPTFPWETTSTESQ